MRQCGRRNSTTTGANLLLNELAGIANEVPNLKTEAITGTIFY